MPYSITTKDGITIQGIPDEVPADSPELKARVAKIRGGDVPSAEQPAAEPSRIKGSVGGAAFMGLRDPIDAGAQLLTRALPDSWVQAGNRLNNRLVDMGVPGLSRLEGPDSGTGQQASSPVDRMVQGANADYDASRALAGRDGIDVARIAGNIANPINRLIPMGGATTAGGVALRAGAQGALSGLAQPVTDTENFGTTKAGQVAIGGAAGAAGGYAIDKLAGAIGSAWARLRASPLMQSMSGNQQAPELIIQQAAQEAGVDLSQIPSSMLGRVRAEVDKAMRSGKTPNVTAALRQAEGKTVLGDDAGLMLGQATRDPQQWAAEVDLRGIQNGGKPVADRLALQNQRLIAAVQKGAANAPDAYDAGAASIKSLQSLDKQLSGEVTAAYQKFREAGGTTLDVPLQPIAQRLGEVLDTYGRENIPASVLSKFESYGLIGGKQTKVFDLLEADKLIKAINANYDPLKAPQAGALGALRKSIGESINLAEQQTEGATGPAADLLKQALGKAKARFGLHEAVPALEAAATDRGAQEAFVRQYITGQSAGIDTVSGLVKLLSPEALDSVKKNVLAGILEKAAPGAGRGSDAATFSQAGYSKALDAIGDRKLSALFGDDVVSQLRQVGRVAEWIQKQPKGSAPNNSNTGAAVMNLLQGLQGSRVMQLPGLNLAKNSLAQATNESASRNALAANIRPAPAQLTPAEINALRPYLGAAGGALGLAATSGVR